MLEARIQQLQTDIVLDIQHAEVQVVKAGSSGRGVPSSWGPKSTSKEKIVIPKSGAKGTSKPQQSRWIEKLALEKDKLKKKQVVKQTDKRKPTAKSKGSKSSSQILPGTSHKTISTTAKKTIPAINTNRGGTKLSDQIRPAVSSKASSTASTAHHVSKGMRKDSKNQHHGEQEQNKTDKDAKSKAKELAEVEKLEKRLSKQANQRTSSSVPERPQVDSEERASGDMQMSIRSFLEACVFLGDIERANHFLMSQHRVIRRRKLLNTDIYNILMRVWAKKVSPKVFKITLTFLHLNQLNNFELKCKA